MEMIEPRPAKQRGRPSLYRSEYAKQARKLCALGAIDKELADFFEVTDRTVKGWRVRYPDFSEACRLGKEVADSRVESSLFSRAVGYSFDSEKILTSNGRVFREPIVVHLPPDVKACILWLTNRKRSEWRINPKSDATGADEEALDREMREDAPRFAPDEPMPANPIL